MSGFRSLANYDHWPSSIGGGNWEVLRPSMVEHRRKMSRSARAKISKVIEKDIIPHLLLAHGVPREETSVALSDNVVVFSRHLLRGDTTAAMQMALALRRNGMKVSEVFLKLLAPSARFLGELWDEDICDFTQVTLAMSQMQQMLRELSAEFCETQNAVRRDTPRALLIGNPGDDHDFGIQMVREFFCRSGWDVAGEPVTYDALLRCTRLQRFDLVGLSVTKDVPVDGLAAIILAIRKNAVDPGLKVMVGGRFFLEHPEFVKQVGADATAPDGRRAVPRISSLLDTSALQC